MVLTHITVGPNSVAGVDVSNVDIGLSETFYGTLTINPRIRNIIAKTHNQYMLA